MTPALHACIHAFTLFTPALNACILGCDECLDTCMRNAQQPTCTCMRNTLACATHLHALCAAAHVPCERASNILRIQHPSHNCPCAAGACAQRARPKHPRERAQSTRAHTGPVDGKKEKRELRQEAVDNSLNDWNCKWGEQDGERHDAIPPSLSCVQGQGGRERSKES